LPAGSLLIRYRQKTPGHLLSCEPGRSRSETAATLGGENRFFDTLFPARNLERIIPAAAPSSKCVHS
jgi:hypothetical protein